LSELTESYGFEYEAIAYGHLQLMTMKHCPMSLFKNCGEDRDCENCQFKAGYEIVDRKDMKFRLRRHKDITTVYNSQRLFIPEHMRKLENSSISYARLEFTNESSDIRDIVGIYSAVIDGVADRSDIERYIEEVGDKANFTKGHYFRGTI
jgi:U32 family peptidase